MRSKYPPFPASRTKGFTLVELSIVLVILGLLVGGVLTGQALIRAAELRSVVTQATAFQTAINAFRDKYFAIPGDMTNAQSFWGVAHATPATCATTQGTGTQTCNGNGNGMVEFAAAGSNEAFRFWQHLVNAGLIEGSYSGITQGSTTYSVTAANAPAAKMNSSLWYTYHFGTISGVSWLFNGEYGNTISLGRAMPNDLPGATLFKNEELWNIDVKLDDGKPATGKILVRPASVLADCTDTSSNTNLNANYLLSGTTPACNPLFIRAY